MIITSLEQLYPDQSEWQELTSQMQEATTFSHLIWLALQLGLLFARLSIQSELTRRAEQPIDWPSCPVCGRKLRSKGYRWRQMKTMIGSVKWKRRIGRCPTGCKGTQVIPLDECLGIAPNQLTDQGLERIGCLLSLMMPYGLASWLLNQWTGLSLSQSYLWKAVQRVGEVAKVELEQQLEQYQAQEAITPETLPEELLKLPLAISADGVMVPMRPQSKTPTGKTQWRECKVGLLARLSKHLNGKGKEVTRLLHKRVVAIVGDIEAFMPRLDLEAQRQSVEKTTTVLWLSDGGKGFWRLYHACFAHCAVGILDFYHAAGHLWRAATAIFDGRSSQAKSFFKDWRHQLRHGQHQQVVRTLTRLINTELFSKTELEVLIQVQGYLQRHREHIRYQHFHEQDYPLGSGMIESTCKWLIQQRFKGVGMRWSEEGFDHLLHLRLAWVNQRFDALFPQVTWVEHLTSPNL